MSMLLKALEGVERDRGEREGGHPGDIQDAGEPAFLKKKKGREAGLLGILAMEEKREDRFRGPDAGSPVGDAGGAGGIAGAATVSSLLFELDDGVKPKAPMGDAAEMVLPGQGQEPLLLVNACAGKQGPTCDHRELGWDSPDKARLLREAASREPVRSRKRLYIGGGALAMLGVLTYGGYVYWQSMMLPSFSMPRPPLAKQIAPPAPPPGALTVSATALSPVSPPSVLAQPPSSGLAPAASPPPVSPSSNLVGVSQVQIPIPPSGSAVQKVETAMAPSSAGLFADNGENEENSEPGKGKRKGDVAIADKGYAGERVGIKSPPSVSGEEKKRPSLESNGVDEGGMVNALIKKRALALRLLRLRQAFDRGRLEEAGQGFNAILVREGENKDALFGMAAVMIRQGRLREAEGYYLKLLQLDPSDSMAMAGLSGIRADVDPLRRESMIKTILQREPDAHHLYFALGGSYAAQKRWGDAQQAFFRAMSGVRDNPDYAFNLAVSLDHLGQRGPALEYYRQAVKLASMQPGGFLVAQAEKRIKALGMKPEEFPEARLQAMGDPL